MIFQRLILLAVLLALLDAETVVPRTDFSNVRSRRSVDMMNWQSADVLYKQLYAGKERSLDDDDDDSRMRRSSLSFELRPIEGPMNIEQLPAMLAARHVKRYPYSQIDDPAIIGR